MDESIQEKNDLHSNPRRGHSGGDLDAKVEEVSGTPMWDVLLLGASASTNDCGESDCGPAPRLCRDRPAEVPGLRVNSNQMMYPYRCSPSFPNPFLPGRSCPSFL